MNDRALHNPGESRAMRVEVLIVGARCAGAMLALHLAKAGLRVLVVDKSRFPSDTLSTHMFEISGAAALHRAGVLDGILETGAQPHEAYCMTVDGVDLSAPVTRRDGDPLGGYSVRRHLLDGHLVHAAQCAGAEIWEHHRMDSLIAESGRVVGARVSAGDTTVTVRADLVVGADGRRSTVAKQAGAKEYLRTENERGIVWCYYENARLERPGRLHFHRRGEDLVFAWPSDSGLLTVIAAPPLRLARKLVHDDAAFHAYTTRTTPLGPLVENARQVGRRRSAVRYPGYFRRAAGAGWVLIGDAGHFKDPVLGQGISDAFRQAETLASTIALSGLLPGRLDRALRRWWRWRDADATEMYWLAYLQGRGRVLPSVQVELLRELSADPAARERLVGLVLAHRARPSSLVSGRTAFRTVTRAMAGWDVPSVLRTAVDLSRPATTCLVANILARRLPAGAGSEDIGKLPTTLTRDIRYE